MTVISASNMRVGMMAGQLQAPPAAPARWTAAEIGRTVEFVGDGPLAYGKRGRLLPGVRGTIVGVGADGGLETKFRGLHGAGPSEVGEGMRLLPESPADRLPGYCIREPGAPPVFALGKKYDKSGKPVVPVGSRAELRALVAGAGVAAAASPPRRVHRMKPAQKKGFKPGVARPTGTPKPPPPAPRAAAVLAGRGSSRPAGPVPGLEQLAAGHRDAYVPGMGWAKVLRSVPGRLRVRFASGQETWVDKRAAHLVDETASSAMDGLKQLLATLPDVPAFFTALDVNSDGHVDAAELEGAAAAAGVPLTAAECAVVIELADTDGNGLLELAEVEAFAAVLQEVKLLRSELLEDNS